MKYPYDYISILGPTATGKTAIAIALAAHCPIEVISVDSVSVYQGLDIGSAKPSVSERQGVPHHLIDICTLDEVYTVGRFVEDANRLIQEIQGRGALPVFCGGTMMYMAALKRGYSTPKVSEAIERDIGSLLEEKGVEHLYQCLLEEDPPMANRLQPKDKQRIMRALAVKRSTGRSLSSYWDNAPTRWKSMDFLLCVNDRERHRTRLRERVNQMLESGLEAECKMILSKYSDVQHPALRSIGYKEMIAHILEKTPTNDVRDQICIASAQFVKRQMTWINSWNNNHMLSIDLYQKDPILLEVVETIVETLR